MARVDPHRALLAGPHAVVFPGVGVKLSGKEAELYRLNRSVMAPFLAEASDRCGVDLEARLLAGTLGDLPDRIQQYFTYGFSVGVFRTFENRFGLTPAAGAGYSFGLYGALYAAEAISFSDGLSILDQAYRSMWAASEDRDLGMGIIIGLTEADLEELLAGVPRDSVVRTNTNHETCFIFSGPCPALSDLLDRARVKEAFAAELLDVAIPYHHPIWLGDAASSLREFLKTISWSDARFPVVSSLDQRLLTCAEDLADLTWRNIASPINWKKVVEALRKAGVVRAFECGPGISLSQNSRFLPFEMPHTNVKKAIRWLRP